MSTPVKICLTAVKNEDWMSRIFLQVMSLIADHILILDQLSTDETRNNSKEFKKVILLDNESPVFNEPERQKILIDSARKLFPGERFFLPFDADEIPSFNILNDHEWNTIVENAKPGTAINLQNICLYNSPYEYRSPDKRSPVLSYLPFAMRDNNEPHSGIKIHT